MRDQHVYLNGVSLETAHPSILLQHIDESAPKADVQTAARGGAPGAFVTSAQLRERAVTILFAVREAKDFTIRADAVSAAAAWAAGGGWLSLSSRPGLRLWVTPTELPSIGRLRDWTDDISLTLTAFHWPWWQEESPTAVTATGVGSTGTEITVPVTGCAPAGLEAEITPGDALTGVTLTSGGRTMTLSNLSVASGTKLSVYYDERHLLRIEAGGTGLLGKRTGDDLVLQPGRRAVTVACSTASTVKLWARGCYL